VVAQVVRDTGSSRAGRAGTGVASDAALRERLGPELHGAFFRFVGPPGDPGAGSSQRRGGRGAPSDAARRNAAAGHPTLETTELAGTRVRLLTVPLDRTGELLQVGLSLQATEQALSRYREILLVLVPLAVALATGVGAAIADAALRPIRAISRTARRIGAEDLGQRIPTRAAGDELDHLAETLNDMLARLDDAFLRTRRFAADAAHELRTPLTVLRGEIEVALRAPRSGEEYHRVLRSGLEEVERLVRLAEDLLLLSRAEASRGAPGRAGAARVDLEPIVLDVLAAGARLAHGTGVALRLAGSAPATVAGDAADLRRALLNLVENAVKYTPAGGTVELRLGRAGAWASIVVRDTGPGIAPADAERVFQPFVRLPAARARATGGSGLGLPIARSIVLAHAGVLVLDSVPGAGSRFTIRLPLAEAAPDIALAAGAADGPSGPPLPSAARAGRASSAAGRPASGPGVTG
jgi:heavy metal sensor kinase